MTIPQVRIEVNGGLAELTEKPQGVRVIIVDYDTDGEAPVVQEYDADGIINHEDCGCLIPNVWTDKADFVPASWEVAQ